MGEKFPEDVFLFTEYYVTRWYVIAYTRFGGEVVMMYPAKCYEDARAFMNTYAFSALHSTR